MGGFAFVLEGDEEEESTDRTPFIVVLYVPTRRTEEDWAVAEPIHPSTAWPNQLSVCGNLIVFHRLALLRIRKEHTMQLIIKQTQSTLTNRVRAQRTHTPLSPQRTQVEEERAEDTQFRLGLLRHLGRCCLRKDHFNSITNIHRRGREHKDRPVRILMRNKTQLKETLQGKYCTMRGWWKNGPIKQQWEG